MYRHLNLNWTKDVITRNVDIEGFLNINEFLEIISIVQQYSHEVEYYMNLGEIGDVHYDTFSDAGRKDEVSLSAHIPVGTELTPDKSADPLAISHVVGEYSRLTLQSGRALFVAVDGRHSNKGYSLYVLEYVGR